MLYRGVVVSPGKVWHSREGYLLIFGVTNNHFLPCQTARSSGASIRYLRKFVCLEIFVKHSKVFDVGQAVEVVGHRVVDDGGIFDFELVEAVIACPRVGVISKEEVGSK